MSKEVRLSLCSLFFISVGNKSTYSILSGNRCHETSSQVNTYEEIIEETHNII